MGQARWRLPMALLNAVLWAFNKTAPQEPEEAGYAHSSAARKVLDALSLAMDTGVKELALQSQPHLVLLQPAFYERHMRPILAQWLLLWLKTVPEVARDLQSATSPALRAGLEASMLAFVGAVDSNTRRCKLVGSMCSPACVQYLNLARDWVGLYLPHVLSKVCQPLHACAL